ncbi:sulfotransferase 1A1-like [Pomacea canaliculata]|uniref:sulfotransferase 1A1-like n=1 Tax=Pomacea canaliculata TaxID=400727 RepID=UPI000D72C5FE|nr:sulfotransferase 1A1-like [Pomacea canaliculata]
MLFCVHRAFETDFTVSFNMDDMQVFRDILADIPVVEVEGVVFPKLFESNRPMAEHIECIRALELNDNDVLLCAYGKAGTHWMWEMGSMLLAGRPDYDKRAKENVMMEAIEVEKLQALPSPRLLNTHLYPSMLPRDVKNKKVKVIHVYRNIKDVMVSAYFHWKRVPIATRWTIEVMDKLFLDEKYVGGNYIMYMKKMAEFRKENPEVPVFNVSFEDMKKDPLGTVRLLAQFLGVPAPPELCEQIADACGFQKMKEANDAKQLPEWLSSLGNFNSHMYRKGEVGDWKNHLTVAQSERLDAAVKELDGLDYHFRYTL